MAQQEEEPGAIAFFPDPPPFYRNFTSENRDRLQEFKTSAAISDGAPLSVSQLLSLPTELRFLVPPEPPVGDEQYRVFNHPTKLNQHAPTLKDWNIDQLYPSPPSPKDGEDPASQSGWTLDRQTYLRRMVRSILVNFVELLGIVAADSTSPDVADKMKNIETIASNMHQLINEYRPHQARETLINIMEEQLEKKRAEVEGIKRMKAKVDGTFAEFRKNAPERGGLGMTDGDRERVSEEERRTAGQRMMWQVMDEVLG
ncbi:MED7-domain-containing protein [Amniculicola lignicola CBS 123094]|uniref:Mediator of RNA polymerase II transcription subunit 7 n=1 Tax=Amniculicola lignicola CBS 123094 TaxID=1392246 RepID=A0A6A5WLI7_9PLEO|nr:MED7-domain-containing protein [Amniculicola lignicola CBS 123094]